MAETNNTIKVMTRNKKYCTLLFAVLVVMLSACSSYDDSIYENAMDGAVQARAAYNGTWMFGEDKASTTYSATNNVSDTADNMTAIVCQDNTLSLNFPIQIVARLAVPTEHADDAANNAYFVDYGFPYSEVGYSANTLYWQIDKPRYVFYTRYGGAAHKIVAFMSNSTVACASDYSQICISLRIDSLQNADKTVARFNPQFELLYISTERIK